MSVVLGLLAEIRQSSERRPFEVLKLAEPLLNANQEKRAGDDVWLVYEQVFVAAIDEGQLEVAKAVLALLHKRFQGGSQRVKRLYGMINEAAGHPDEAKKIYDEMLVADETNVLAHKRLVALLKGSGQQLEAIAMLVQYVDTHSNDFEAWLELSSLYLARALYPQAAFCLEEVILQQPANHYFHQCYAEINYTMGRLDIALKEFLRVVELSTDNVRGFYGVKLVADRIAELRAAPKRDAGFRLEDAPQPATLQRLAQLATERLVAIYNGAGETSRRTTEAWLKE
ncbi:tetratricopeptide repeat domain-containing protein [Coemansia sp. RSA 552]|nr:tetratricopeptide repeat domain-containing protein [Coemansia sp. RSA 552]